MALNAPTPSAQTEASVPPAMTAVASPRRIHSAASPMAWAAEAQALTTARFGPLAPCSIAIIPAGMSAIIDGTVNGETRRTPCMWRFNVARSSTSSPPTPDATSTPASLPSAVMSSPESVTASRAATSASWMQRLLRRASLTPRTAAASNPLTSAAMRVGSADASNCVIGPTPLVPARHALHVDATSWPSGLIAPIPVMTMRALPLPLLPLLVLIPLPACLAA